MICIIEKKPDSYDASIQRVYYDHETGRCEIIEYDGNDRIILKENYINSKLNGECIKYDRGWQDDDKNTTVEIYEYKDGQKNGIYKKTKLATNELICCGFYKNGVAHGQFISKTSRRRWDIGIIQTTIVSNYINGEQHGKLVRYDNGKIINEKNYEHGKLHGPEKRIIDNELKVVALYEHGNQKLNYETMKHYKMLNRRSIIYMEDFRIIEHKWHKRLQRFGCKFYKIYARRGAEPFVVKMNEAWERFYMPLLIKRTKNVFYIKSSHQT